MNLSERILKILRHSSDKHISGSELAEGLGVSRTTVWNHINDLKKHGYEFDSSTNLGYQLVSIPDRMLPDEISEGLHTKLLGRKIISYEEIDSTNDLAMRLAADGAEEGTVVFAERQRKGRGRLHRKWHSPRKKDILMSVILRPELHPRKATQLTIVSAVAAALAIRKISGLHALIKWPNDIFINEKKCGGILIEMSAELDTIKHVAVGIGINVNSRKSDFPKGFSRRATSLSIELGRKCDRVAFARAVLEHLEEQYKILMREGFEGIRKEWSDLSLSLGRRIETATENELITGTPIRLDEDGSLVVRTDTGIIRSISSGDISVH